jgi:YidC/Oxa1 family membrane protein insertase
MVLSNTQPLLFDVAGFYWIPTLAGPTSLDNRGTEWLFPLVDGAPPIGWDAASHYLVLPILLVICQYISSAIISPPIDPNAENANTQRALYTFLPLMVGYFALVVPSGGWCGTGKGGRGRGSTGTGRLTVNNFSTMAGQL